MLNFYPLNILTRTSQISQFTKIYLSVLIALFGSITNSNAQGFEGYYQYPEIHNDQIYFSSEGDIWTVALTGGLAQRLTTHQGEESYPVISPDGMHLAYTASYEGPAEIYIMPSTGGIPERWTYESETSIATCWTPDGKLAYTTSHYSTIPDLQIVLIDLQNKSKERLPLSQASEASFDKNGKTVYFVRPAYHRNVTKRYKGGTARKIWKYTTGSEEATCLTSEYSGESHHPMVWNSRIYFITDRDGVMNIWSMNTTGQDVKQHTYHQEFDVRSASQHNGRIVYQIGADLWSYEISSGNNAKIKIKLASDMDQLRQKWVDDPKDYITSAHLHPGGEKIVITSRGRVFVAPVKSGRFVQISRKNGIRYRDAVFMPDGDHILTLSDETGEFEFITMSASGIGDSKPLTNNGKILRYQGTASPDGKWIAYDDLQSNMWILNVENGSQKKISSNQEGIGQFSWSPDSKWVAYVQDALNSMSQIFLYHVENETTIELTTDRANSRDPQWSPDGKWIYFLSDRNFQTLVGSPWGPRQPEPYFDRQMKIYHIPLRKGEYSPFRALDELSPSDLEKSKSDSIGSEVIIDPEGIQKRLYEVPLKPGNYRGLGVTEKAIYFLSRGTGIGAGNDLMALKIDRDDPKEATIVQTVQYFELSQDGKKIMIRKSGDYYVFNAVISAVSKLNESKINLNSWKFALNTREDWRQIFTDAWRMERDYFYDPNMHGVDWDAMYQKYLPLVDRVTTRNELSDLIGRFVGELSALHTSVRGGDIRTGDEQIRIASLGARFARKEDLGGYQIEYIYKADPDYPDERAPLDDPALDISEGDVLTHINGVPLLSVKDPGELLRNQSGQQVRITVKSASNVSNKDFIVVAQSNEYSLRYRDWEYNRRMKVEKLANGKIGYVHLRAMGSNDLAQWYREFYPVFNRAGLIIDVRHNRGGNIESFILEKLLRKAWMYWKTKTGEPYWNMQYAFRGHIVVLCDQNTASDGEAFADGFRRLGLGKVIGTRTWGGEIWLSSANRLTDGGLARAPMMGVYGPEGEWLIEGHGFVPDIEVDNLPHATFTGNDAQLETAVRYLLAEIEKDPREVPPPPPYPDKSHKTNR